MNRQQKLKFIGLCTIPFLILISFSQYSNAATFTHDFQASTGTGWFGNIYLQKFSGLPVGQQITKFGMFTGDSGSGKFFQAPTLSGHSTNLNGFVWARQFSIPQNAHINYVTVSVSNNGSNPNTGSGVKCSGCSLSAVETGDIWFYKFTGINPGSTIVSAGAKIGAIGDGTGKIRVKLYQDDGTSGAPKTLLAETEQTVSATGLRNYTISATVPTDGNIWLGYEFSSSQPQVNYMTTGGSLQGFAHTYGAGPTGSSLSLSSFAPTEFGAIINYQVAPGHIRAKLYQADGSGGGPNTLIAESGSQTIVTTGLQNFTITGQVPSTNTIWVGFETDIAKADLGLASTGSVQAATHTFGTGPNPFGTYLCPTCTNVYIGVNYTVTASAINAKFYKDDGTAGQPSTLLGELDNQDVISGKQNFTLSSTVNVPASGNVWAGFETNSTILNLKHTASPASPPGQQIIAHTYGTGPSPFGTGICGVCSDYPWSQLTLQPRLFLNPSSGLVGDTIAASGTGFGITKTITLKLDGSVLVTSPGTITSNSTGGFSGTFVIPAVSNGVHTVNATDTTGNWTTASLTVGTSTGLDSSSGHVQDLVTGHGNGFTANSLLTVKYDGNVITTIPASVTTDHLGQFNGTQFHIPSSTRGIHVISFTDASANTASNNFDVFTSMSVSPTSGKFSDIITASGNGYGNTQTITITFNGATQTTTPATITTNSTGSFTGATFPEPLNTPGTYTIQATDASANTASTSYSVTSSIIFTKPCGAGVCSPKLVNYTASRTVDFKTLNLVVYVNPIPFNLECLITNGTFIQHSAWHNFTSVSSASFGTHVVPDDNAFYACYGSGLLFSGTSPGNATAIITAAKAGDESIGQFLGVPLGVFFIVLAASLANQRTGSIYAVIVLAMIGIAGLVGFFTLDPKIWGAAVVTGMLALLLGKKIW